MDLAINLKSQLHRLLTAIKFIYMFHESQLEQDTTRKGWVYEYYKRYVRELYKRYVRKRYKKTMKCTARLGLFPISRASTFDLIQ